MKQILLAALAAMAITSCSQSEDIPSAGNDDGQITFNTVVKKSTRATPMVTDKFASFSVYGYNTQADFDGTAALGSAFMDNVAATKAADGSWTLAGGPYYWPLTGKMQFFAVSPAANVTAYAVGTPSGFPSFSYTIQNQQEDLLAAQTVNAAKSANAVQLSFSHLLTQVNFSAALEANFDYAITSIKIVGVGNSGTFTYAADKGAWSTVTGTASYEYAGNFSATPTDNIVNLSKADNALMLMPQTLPDGAKIEVTYKATATTGNKQITFDGTKSITIEKATWTPGQNIRYKLQLPSGAQDISFSTSIGNWDNATDEAKNPA